MAARLLTLLTSRTLACAFGEGVGLPEDRPWLYTSAVGGMTTAAVSTSLWLTPPSTSPPLPPVPPVGSTLSPREVLGGDALADPCWLTGRSPRISALSMSTPVLTAVVPAGPLLVLLLSGPVVMATGGVRVPCGSWLWWWRKMSRSISSVTTRRGEPVTLLEARRWRAWEVLFSSPPPVVESLRLGELDRLRRLASRLSTPPPAPPSPTASCAPRKLRSSEVRSCSFSWARALLDSMDGASAMIRCSSSSDDLHGGSFCLAKTVRMEAVRERRASMASVDRPMRRRTDWFWGSFSGPCRYNIVPFEDLASCSRNAPSRKHSLACTVDTVR
mmetsp:Transcript_6359/g.10424  ORF Transcript_6359/g.10424 Transcript_6359/m.10424 type:complete len:330 (+) Transcript_6359:1537-2526(+)